MFRRSFGRSTIVSLCCVGTCCFAMPLSAWAATSATDALKYKPVQKDVAYEIPSAAAAKDCLIKTEDGGASWVVRAANGDILRKFTDTNKDKRVDTWCYFSAGLEVYRDIDSDFNGQADQYRWFNSAGMRWGIDKDEDSKIDSWKLISAEEAAEEVVAAAKTNDTARFKRLLLSVSELKKLGLPAATHKRLAARLQTAQKNFSKLTASKSLKKDLEFRDFGGLKPGMVPAKFGSKSKDLLVYESVWAMVYQAGDFEQLQLGTMINVQGAWKLIDCPEFGNTAQVAGGFFYGTNPGNVTAGNTGLAIVSEPTAKMQEVLAKLEKIDQQLMQVTGKRKMTLNNNRAGLLLELANVSNTAAERSQWLRQLADMVSAGTQDGSFPNGIKYLKKLEAQLAKAGQSDDLLAYFEFRRMLAKYYGVTLAKADVDHAKAHEQWLKDLEAFVEAHPKNDDCAEALRQLAMGSEISGENKQAIKWYSQIIADHPDSFHTPMAKGAVVRLGSVGRQITLKGKSVTGSNVDLTKLRGKSVVIQYWTSTNDVCKADHAVLNNLYKKHGGGRGLAIISVNLDYERNDLMAYLKANRLPWPQLFESGGFESRYAQEMGVVTVPLMMLVGPDGKVVNDNILAAEIEAALKKSQTRQASRPKS